MHFSFWFGALALAVPALCLPTDLAPPPPVNGSTEMIPINIHNSDPASGNRRRAAVQLSSMDPRTQDEVVYGRHAGPSDLPLLPSLLS